MKLSIAFRAAAILLGLSLWTATAADKPNIVYVLCDDLGYGDVHCLNPERGRIATPNIDRLATQGMVFTDAHSGSSVCTPTRYGVMTGRYAWRTHLQNGVLGGESPPLIAADRLTVPALLTSAGYRTACIGKWHLGMEWPKDKQAFGGIDWTKPIAHGPVARGFDVYYGISASLDMPPYVWIDQDRPTAPGTVEKQWLRKGPAAADFEVVDVLPGLVDKASAFIRTSAGAPFFLYLPLNSPHTPIVPTKAWQGKSGLGDYGDFVMQTDDALGQILKALDEAGVASNTLVIFTSDNGCSPAAGIDKLEAQGHFPSAAMRGHKADIWDGGHRVPFIARWPAVVKPGTRTDRLTCLTDLMATCAEIAGAKLPDNAGEDSVSFAGVLGTGKGVRDPVVHHSISGRFAIRDGQWKLALCSGSAGWSLPKDPAAEGQQVPAVQLFDLATDPGEQKNLQDQHPDIVARLKKQLEKYVAEGRSTPGVAQKNDVTVDILKTTPRDKGRRPKK